MKMPVKLHTIFAISLFISSVNFLDISVLADDNNEQPGIDFLEFLGSFETPDGKWLDPMEIESMPSDKNTTMFDRAPQQEINDNE